MSRHRYVRYVFDFSLFQPFELANFQGTRRPQRQETPAGEEAIAKRVRAAMAMCHKTGEHADHRFPVGQPI